MKESTHLKRIIIGLNIENLSHIEMILSQCYLSTIYFKIFISYQQIVNIISGIELSWPLDLSNFFYSVKYMTFFTQSAPSLECLYSGINNILLNFIFTI